MQVSHNAIMISDNDNVATVIAPVECGGSVSYLRGGETRTLIVVDSIPAFHKVAVIDIRVGEPVYKYGQIMAAATAFIPKGSHVHTHNIRSACEVKEV